MLAGPSPFDTRTIALKLLRYGPKGQEKAGLPAESGMPIPAEPVVFAKWTSAIVGPDDAVEIPRGSVKTDWEVDGRRYQTGNTRTMVFTVAQIVSYLSRFMSLQPGDVISTGTPPGVGLGQKPPVFLRAGQTMRLGIQGLGEQTQHVVQA